MRSKKEKKIDFSMLAFVCLVYYSLVLFCPSFVVFGSAWNTISAGKNGTAGYLL